MVNTETESYAVARSYMIRLEASDFADKTCVRRLARVCKMTPAKFARRFNYLVN